MYCLGLVENENTEMYPEICYVTEPVIINMFWSLFSPSYLTNFYIMSDASRQYGIWDECHTRGNSYNSDDPYEQVSI